MWKTKKYVVHYRDKSHNEMEAHFDLDIDALAFIENAPYDDVDDHYEVLEI